MHWDYAAKNKSRAKRLRKEMTPQERKLWYCFLRHYPVKFNRQRTIGPYIIDFYCATARLAVELDGSGHYEGNGPAYDAARTQYLNERGICVLRFTNTELQNSFDAVREELHRLVQTRRER